MQTEKSFEHVTNRQGMQLAEHARNFGVSRKEFKKLLDNPIRLQEFFNSLKQDNLDWFPELLVEAGKIGACVHVVTVMVDYTKSHYDAAMAGGPQTPSDYNVLKVGDKYDLPETGTIEEIIILLRCFNNRLKYHEIVEWGIKNGLNKTVPHEIFAIGEGSTRYNYELGLYPIRVVETTGCSYGNHDRACNVYFHSSGRESSLRQQSDFGGNHTWYAFRSKINSPKIRNFDLSD